MVGPFSMKICFSTQLIDLVDVNFEISHSFLDFTYFADDPNAPGVAHLYLADRAKHDEIAAEWTLRFAK